MGDGANERIRPEVALPQLFDRARTEQTDGEPGLHGCEKETKERRDQKERGRDGETSDRRSKREGKAPRPEVSEAHRVIFSGTMKPARAFDSEASEAARGARSRETRRREGVILENLAILQGQALQSVVIQTIRMLPGLPEPMCEIRPLGLAKAEELRVVH